MSSLVFSESNDSMNYLIVFPNTLFVVLLYSPVFPAPLFSSSAAPQSKKLYFTRLVRLQSELNVIREKNVS